MRIYHIYLISFNFLNGKGMRIVLNKRGGVGMGATRPKSVPLPFLISISTNFYKVMKMKGFVNIWKLMQG